MPKKIPSLRVSIILSSISDLMDKISKIFDETKSPVLELKTELPKHIYCVMSPELIIGFFNDPIVGISKPPGLMPREDWLMRDSLIADVGNHWKNKRTVMSPPFLTKNYSAFLDHILPAVKRLLKKVEHYKDTDTRFDIHLEMRRCTIDFSLRMFFSEQLSDKDLDTVTENVTHLENGMPEQIPLWIPTPSNLNFKFESKKLRDFCASLIAKRRGNQAKPGDYLDHLLAVEDIESLRPWSEEEITDQMLAVFLGASAIATPLTWTAYQLSCHPDVCRKMITELSLVAPDEEMVGYEASKSLIYFESIIKETMRLYPTFWGNIRYNQQPFEIDDYAFPKKSTFLLLRYFANRHPQFWPNPQAFDPLRFDPENPEKTKSKYHLPFGGGPRTCLGIHLSVPIIKMILGALFSKYELFDTATTPNGQTKIVFNYGVYPAKPILLHAKARVKVN